MKKLIPNLILVLTFFLIMNVKVNGQTAYVTDSFGIHVIDVTTNMVTDSIHLFNNYHQGAVSVSPDGTKVYVAGTDTIDVINTATNTVSAKIPGINAAGIVVSPDGSKLYASADNRVYVINTTANSVTDTITIHTNLIGDMLDGICVSPDGTKVYVVDNSGNGLGYLCVINTLVDTVDATINIPGMGGSHVYDVAITPDGTKVYVGLEFGVNVINTSTNTIEASMGVVGWAYEITISPDGSKAYASCWTSQSVFVINTATNTITDTIHIPGDIWGISITPDGSKLYVANSHDNNVTVVSTATNTVIDSIPVARYPIAFGNFISTYPVITTGIPSQSNPTPTISIYPNPNNGTFSIRNYELGIRNEIHIYDVLGQEIYHQPINHSTQSTINLPKLSNGVYFYQLIPNQSGDKETLRGKFIVEQ